MSTTDLTAHDAEPTADPTAEPTPEPTASTSSWFTRERILDIISAIARFGMAFVWIKAGTAKLGVHMDITQAITAYQIFTPEVSEFLARLIGPLEIAGGVLLLLGLFLRGSSVVSTFVLVLFIIGVSQAWARGMVIDCGCFDPTDLSVEDAVAGYKKVIIRDIVLIGLSLWTYFRPFKKFALYTR